MDKAEEANKRYRITRGDDTEETSGIDMQGALDFIDGYHQAEKNLELTWEDVKLIHNITYEESRNVSLNKGGEISEKEFYQEV